MVVCFFSFLPCVHSSAATHMDAQLWALGRSPINKSILLIKEKNKTMKPPEGVDSSSWKVALCRERRTFLSVPGKQLFHCTFPRNFVDNQGWDKAHCQLGKHVREMKRPKEALQLGGWGGGVVLAGKTFGCTGSALLLCPGHLCLTSERERNLARQCSPSGNTFILQDLIES